MSLFIKHRLLYAIIFSDFQSLFSTEFSFDFFSQFLLSEHYFIILFDNTVIKHCVLIAKLDYVLYNICSEKYEVKICISRIQFAFDFRDYSTSRKFSCGFPITVNSRLSATVGIKQCLLLLVVVDNRTRWSIESY